MEIPESDWVGRNALAFAVRDRFPVAKGHTLVITRRIVPTWFEATREEQMAILDLVDVVKRELDEELSPAGYNVGFNVGTAAGQTVMHLHVHVIPRYEHDMDDPRGGVRHVIPWKGNYLRGASPPLSRGGPQDPFLAHLLPLFACCSEVAVIAAFVQDSGLELLHDSIFSAAERGAQVRLITGDYLNITQADALLRLLDWQGALEPNFQTRVVETAKLPSVSQSFHPKCWRFDRIAFVGSSNVSHSALTYGIEWNLRVERAYDPLAFARIVEGFEALWTGARPLTLEWAKAYAERARAVASQEFPPGETEVELPPVVAEPHEIQRDALARLAEARREGRRRALVVMATGLGKTLVAALDAKQVREERGGECPRVLFVAHRRELLAQAAEVFRRVLRPRSTGWFAENRLELSADVVVASVQKLSLKGNLARLQGERFDYVVVDEVHHANAPSYRKILAQLDSGFVLGLTATPDRADEGDILGLFDDFVAFRADLGVGITAGRLAPFRYYGLKDTVDYNYKNIPWRNGRFDTKELEKAVQTQRRMERLWEAWGTHVGTRTLVFCCTIPHAKYVCDWLAEHEVRVVAVYSREGSADRAEALRMLGAGELDAVCAVDLFNEGVDVPLIDRVVMLRPTESPVIFLQQLGRGLRSAPGKEELVVIDFVGNHRVFLDRVRTLLSFGERRDGLRRFFEDGVARELPPGCSVEVELEAVDLLRRFLVTSGGAEVERAYDELVAARGERPQAGELFRMGHLPSSLGNRWFEFVESRGHLLPAEERVLAGAREWFHELESQRKTAMTKCYKMVLLQALLDAGAWQEGLPLDELAQRSWEILSRSPELKQDTDGVKELAGPHDKQVWERYWRSNPVDAWCGGQWFRIEGGRMLPRLEVEDQATFAEMTRELVDYRLAQYRWRVRAKAAGDEFVCKVTWNKRDPILKLPAKAPRGELGVKLLDGRVWQFRMKTEYCNVARSVGTDRNELPDLMREWFGPGAGRPGTVHQVRFYLSPDGWRVEPLGQVIDMPRLGRLVAFPTLRAAAGAADGGIADAPEAEEVYLPVKATGKGLFAVRAIGDSMDGGNNPIRNGDWLVFRFARSAGFGSVEGRVALVQVDAGHEDSAYQVKRVVKKDGEWLLKSDNPQRQSFLARPGTVPIALLTQVIRPESMGPAPGTVLSAKELAQMFGLDAVPQKTERVNGHLFVVRTSKPPELSERATVHRPAEKAFIVVQMGQGLWKFQGIGEWSESDGVWRVAKSD